MASSTDDSEDESLVVLGTAVPELAEGEAHKKPTTIQDLTARDKQGRRRFHGAFTGGFSAGYFNTVGTKEGFTPSTFVSSRSKKNETSESRPEDFMDEEDFDEHGIAPRKFATVGSYTSEERKRKLHEDAQRLTASSHVSLAPSLTDLIIPEELPIGIKILRKMGWREGQGLGPRVKKKKKKIKRKTEEVASTNSDSTLKVYGCASLLSDQGESDSDEFLPENLSSITFAPKDVYPISLEAKDNVHGLGYRRLDPSLALPGSHMNLFDAPPVRSHKVRKGIQGQAFGVGAFEKEDEDIYAMDNMSGYDITMRADDDEGDNKFGWTAPRDHGKQVVPVSYVGKLLEGFTLSSQPLKLKKTFSPPVLPRDFKPQHWFRKRREISHLPTSLTRDDYGVNQKEKITAIDRGLMLGETPIMSSVFDLVPKEDKNRIEATKQAIAMTQSLTSKASSILASRFQPAQDGPAVTTARSPTLHTSSQSDSAGLTNTLVKPTQEVDERLKGTAQSDKAPLFQGGLNFQPFRKDPAKQTRYDTYLTSVKHGGSDPYSSVDSSRLTEWEKSREREEFSKAAKIYRPMSALMSSRFVRGAMIDDESIAVPLDAEIEKSDQAKAAEMKMFGKLTREEFEWHPDKLLCRRFNVPNPYPGSDLVGLPTVKRQKYSVFSFLNFGDYQSEETQEPSVARTEVSEPESRERTMKPARPRKATMASIFKVLDDPDFHQPLHQSVKGTAENFEKTVNKDNIEKGDINEEKNESETETDKDLFRAIFKNSDSESSSDESAEDKKDEATSGEEEYKSDSQIKEGFSGGQQANLFTPASETSSTANRMSHSLSKEDLVSPNSITLLSTAVPDSEVSSKRQRSRWGQKSIFSVLNDLDKDEVSIDNRETPDGATETDTVLARLSPPNSPHIAEDDSEGEYGPKLPPASTSTTDIYSYKQVSEKTLKTVSSEDKEHRHRKEKKKKSKHKKAKKHKKHKKSSKSRKSQKEKNSSGSEADTENSDVSDSELLQRLKEVSQSGTSLQVLRKL